jgi:quinoprotein glucose dehydrogenase
MRNRFLLALASAAYVTAVISAQTEWRTYGNDAGHQRFSTLTQITPANVSQLTKAWEFDTKVKGRKWQNTPVVIDGTMYITLQDGGVVALEPETGRELWRYEKQVRGRSLRSVAYWPGDAQDGPRLLYGAGDQLIELDPKTGKPIESFGTHGVIEVHPGRRPARDTGFGGSGFQLSSPPAIYKNLAILGGSLNEGAVNGPPGDPQAFDIKTGKLVWRFHTVPEPGEPNSGTWGEGWKNRGGPAVWD